jgi:hypothetical protein
MLCDKRAVTSSPEFSSLLLIDGGCTFYCRETLEGTAATEGQSEELARFAHDYSVQQIGAEVLCDLIVISDWPISTAAYSFSQSTHCIRIANGDEGAVNDQRDRHANFVMLQSGDALRNSLAEALDKIFAQCGMICTGMERKFGASQHHNIHDIHKESACPFGALLTQAPVAMAAETATPACISLGHLKCDAAVHPRLTAAMTGAGMHSCNHDKRAVARVSRIISLPRAQSL